MTGWTSRLSAKGQVTVPKEVRDSVGLKPGDLVAYELEDGHIVLRPVEPFDAAYHAAMAGTLDEWSSSEDELAFHDL